jgi:hypothetical protein
VLKSPSTDSLYRQVKVMGDAFLQLHPAVRRFHSPFGTHILRGEVRMQAPHSWAARQLARLLGSPLHAVNGTIRFRRDAQADRKTWTRHFPPDR